MNEPKRTVLCTGASGSVGTAVMDLLSGEHPDWLVNGQFRSQPEKPFTLAGRSSVKYWQIDLAQPSSTWTLPDGVDILINCAGLSSGKSLAADVTPDEIDLVMRVNLGAVVDLVQRYVPGMVERGFGRVISVNSIWGLRGSVRNTAYTMSKHGLTGLTRTLAKEYGSTGVTANEVCPGPIDSDMMRRIAEGAARDLGKPVEEVLAEWMSSEVGGRFVSPREVAEVVAFLATSASSGVNGVSIPVDLGAIC